MKWQPAKSVTDPASEFQTPIPVCRYMVSLLPEGLQTILEPTKGRGNIVSVLEKKYTVTAPDDFFSMQKTRFDGIVMNPPFSDKSAFGLPADFTKSGMAVGYHILNACLQMSDNIIALMPWFTISDSDVRLRGFYSFGLISVTVLPRKTFNYARIQTVVLQFKKGHIGSTEFKVYDMLATSTIKLL